MLVQDLGDPATGFGITFDRPVEQVKHYPGWWIGEFIFKLSLGFFEGNIVKYVCRYEKKNGKEDLLKARDYLDQLIKMKYPD